MLAEVGSPKDSGDTTPVKRRTMSISQRVRPRPVPKRCPKGGPSCARRNRFLLGITKGVAAKPARLHLGRRPSRRPHCSDRRGFGFRVSGEQAVVGTERKRHRGPSESHPGYRLVRPPRGRCVRLQSANRDNVVIEARREEARSRRTLGRARA